MAEACDHAGTVTKDAVYQAAKRINTTSLCEFWGLALLEPRSGLAVNNRQLGHRPLPDPDRGFGMLLAARAKPGEVGLRACKG
jgi:hypothetical protein